MVDFQDEDLSGSRFTRVRLKNAEFRDSDLSGALFHGVWLQGISMRGVEISDTEIYGELRNVRINGVDVWPLITAELDRRYPDRPLMRPTDAAGFRTGWDTVERLWVGTVARARDLAATDANLLHESVDGEWSFIQTLRHLAFATESWLARAILGDPTPWDALSLPWEEAPDTPGVPHDRTARPSLDTALALRHSRMAMMRGYVDALTDDQLAGDTTPVEGPGWPESRSYPVRECLLTILNEEWEHRLYAERDLDVLTTRMPEQSEPLETSAAQTQHVVVGGAQPALDQRLSDELDRFNHEAVGELGLAEELTVQILTDTGELVAGISGWTWGVAAGIGMTWVREASRGAGFGAELLARFETEAVRRGSTHIFVTSFTFQAPDFYAHHGYREIFRWDGVPTPEVADVHLRKDF